MPCANREIIRGKHDFSPSQRSKTLHIVAGDEGCRLLLYSGQPFPLNSSSDGAYLMDSPRIEKTIDPLANPKFPSSFLARVTGVIGVRSYGEGLERGYLREDVRVVWWKGGGGFLTAFAARFFHGTDVVCDL
jgi:hypothetical protein